MRSESAGPRLNSNLELIYLKLQSHKIAIIITDVVYYKAVIVSRK